jgi:hypothetical protein
MFWLKLGCSLLLFSLVLPELSYYTEKEIVPELAERMAIEHLALLGNVHPETSLPTDGAGALNDKPQHVARIRWRWQVNVPTGYIW